MRDRLPPGEQRTFLLTAGEPFDGLPGIDLSRARVLLSAEAELRGARIRPCGRSRSPRGPALEPTG